MKQLTNMRSWLFSLISLFPIIIYHDRLTLNAISIIQLLTLLLGLIISLYTIDKLLPQKLKRIRCILFPIISITYEYLIMRLPAKWCLFSYQKELYADIVFLVFAGIAGFIVAINQRKKPINIVELH
ncbi:MAG: hypothetical protein N4A74_24785 [Carboxylicivirga sp.]|nr:hypothetical protein [Carboxylicivirga sp.]